MAATITATTATWRRSEWRQHTEQPGWVGQLVARSEWPSLPASAPSPMRALSMAVFRSTAAVRSTTRGGRLTAAEIGVVAGGKTEITNAGTISGGAGFASISFLGTGPNVLTLQTGSVLNGDALGSTAPGATNKLVLQGSATANNNFLNFTSLDVQTNSFWVLNGKSSVGAVAINGGTLEVGDSSRLDTNLTGNVVVNSSGLLVGQGRITGDRRCNERRRRVTGYRAWDCDWHLDGDAAMPTSLPARLSGSMPMAMGVPASSASAGQPLWPVAV